MGNLAKETLITVTYDRSQESMSGSVKNQPGSESGARDGSEFYYWPNRLKIENLRELTVGLMGEKTRTKNIFLSFRNLDRKLAALHFFKIQKKLKSEKFKNFH